MLVPLDPDDLGFSAPLDLFRQPGVPDALEQVVPTVGRRVDFFA